MAVFVHYVRTTCSAMCWLTYMKHSNGEPSCTSKNIQEKRCTFVNEFPDSSPLNKNYFFAQRITAVSYGINLQNFLSQSHVCLTCKRTPSKNQACSFCASFETASRHFWMACETVDSEDAEVDNLHVVGLTEMAQFTALALVGRKAGPTKAQTSRPLARTRSNTTSLHMI
jgi:hypothetical protein